jgi:hypothetical protein|tara:strand:+ start:1190 stop:1420 length:231 start_codon:yes stop_codon:yes gene_type:complete
MRKNNKNKEANIISFKIVINTEGKIISEIANLPKFEAKRFFKGHDLKLIETLIDSGLVKFGKLHYQMQNELNALNN